jgi:tetratricopeptide (TPR) repeat protein
MAGNKDSFQKAMNQGHSAAWDQDWEKAANCYSAALDEFPENPQALSSLGLALFELQDYPSALECYRKAGALTPQDPIPQEKIARIYERMGRLNDAVTASTQAAEMHLKARSAEKAIDNWLRVISLQPENTGVRTRLAAVYERMGRKEQAATEYISLASIYQRTGDLTRAFKLVEYAFKMLPESQEVRLALSMLRSNQLLPKPSRPAGLSLPPSKVQVQEEDLATYPGDTGQDPVAESRQKAIVELAGMLFDQADSAGAASSSRSRGISALARGASGEGGESGDRTRIVMHLSQAIESQTMNDTNQAVVELEHALNLGLRLPAAYFDLGLMLKDSSPERALRYLQQSLRHPDFALASQLICGQVYEQTGQWHQAASAFLQALGLADAQVVPANQADEVLGQYESLNDGLSHTDLTALQSICKAVNNQIMRPNWRSYLVKAREHLPQQPPGNPPTPVAEMVLETRSGQVVEAMAQVRRLASEGQVRSALEEALYALQFAPTYMPLHVLIGDLMFQNGHTGDAVHKFLVVADLYSVRGEVSRAVRILRRVSQIMPADLTVRQRIIDLLVSQDKIEEALQEYTYMADLYYSLAELEKSRQTYMDALKIAQKSKDNRKWGVAMLLKVADIEMQQLNLRQALRIYEQIRAIQTDNASVRLQIVNLNFRMGQEAAAMKELDVYLAALENANRRADAIQFINDLLADNPRRLDLRRRLADLYIRNNQLNEAVIQLDAAADALLSENKHYEAINLLETIVSLNPPNIGEYKAALESLRRDMLRK